MTNAPPSADTLVLPKLSISQILLEDVSFRHVGDFLTRDAKEEFPDTPGQVNVEVARTPDGNAVVRLRLVSSDPRAAYQYTVTYVVLFKVDGDGPPDLDKRLAVTGANMAMPFVRELVANLTSRGRFGVRWVAPMNFNRIVTVANEEQTIESNPTTAQ